jgi:hypothetical protein
LFSEDEMKTLMAKLATSKLTAAAVTLSVAAGTAAAQTMKAEIPFPFRAGKAILAPGTYQINRIQGLTGPSMFRLMGGGGKAVLLVPTATSEGTPETVAPVLTFLCGVSRCALSGLSVGSGHPAYHLSPPRLGRDDQIAIPTRAD